MNCHRTQKRKEWIPLCQEGEGDPWVKMTVHVENI